MSRIDVEFIRQALDGLAQRQAAIATNIANAETPGYQRATVNFEALLRQQLSRQEAAGRSVTRSLEGGRVALQRTDARHLPVKLRGGGGGFADMTAGRARDVIGGGSRNDGNTVDLDQEMTDLALTQVRYAGLAAALSARMRTLRAVIENG